MSEWLDQLQSVLTEAESGVVEAMGLELDRASNDLIHWLEARILAVIEEIQQIIGQLESGLPMAYLGLGTEEDADELVEAYRQEIRGLLNRVQALKEMSRGGRLTR